MLRHLLLIIILAVLATPAAWPQQGALDGNETLFTVLTAINAAGYDADLESPANHPLRNQVRRRLATIQLPSVEKLKSFFEEHRQQNWAAELSQYISYALLVEGPPTFEFKMLIYELPPDAQRLEGLGPLLAQFYQEARISELWQSVQPAYDQMIVRYHEPVSRTLLEVNGYLRNPTSGVSGRKFQVVVAPMAAPNQIHVRSYLGDYYVVVTPSPEPQIRDIRYSYLHYILDPLATRYMAKLNEKKALGDYALGAPFLEEHYKSDFLLLATTSLIKAIEARLDRAPADQRIKMADKAYRRGYILTPHFAEQLPLYEKQEQAMRLYLSEIVDAIDLAKEEARAQNLEFEQQQPVRKAKQVPADQIKQPTAAEKELATAEELYRKKDLENARESYLGVLQESDDKPLHAKAYYGLARIAALNNDPELSVALFEKTLGLSPEPQEKAWTLVYLGRLKEASGEWQEAADYYRAALAVEGASPGAHEAAKRGITQSEGRSESAR